MQSQSQFNLDENSQESEEIYMTPKKQMNYQFSLNNGPWTQREKVKYIMFIQNNREILIRKSKRRNTKIFKRMSIFLETRNLIQCRSYHKKTVDKFKNLTKIITSFKNQIGYQKFSELSQQISQSQLEKTLNLPGNKTQPDDKKQYKQLEFHSQTSNNCINPPFQSNQQLPKLCLSGTLYNLPLYYGNNIYSFCYFYYNQNSKNSHSFGNIN